MVRSEMGIAGVCFALGSNAMANCGIMLSLTW